MIIEKIIQPIDTKMLKTDEQIIYAAMKVFSRFPLEVATLRMIAQEADVTLSLITYHFKTKENLYQEVLARVLPGITEGIQEPFKSLRDRGLLTPDVAKTFLRDAIIYVADRIYGNPNLTLLGQIIMREHFSPSSVYDVIYEQYFKKVLDALALLIAAITSDSDQRKVSLQAFSIFGQILSVAYEREMMKRYIGMDGFTMEEANELKEFTIRNVFAQLGVASG
jgi:AcrR family transcriptional regulator